jgi:hypothetical protein
MRVGRLVHCPTRDNIAGAAAPRSSSPEIDHRLLAVVVDLGAEGVGETRRCDVAWLSTGSAHTCNQPAASCSGS